MAGQSDGSIIIDTELNTDGLKAGSSELLSAMKSLTDEVKKLGTLLKETFSKPLTPEVNTSDAEQRVAALEEQVRELQSLIDEANNGQSQQAAPGANLGDTVQRASSLQKQIEAVNASVEKLEPTFQRAMSGSASAMTTFDGRATALENKIAELREQLEAAGRQKIPTEDYQWLTTEIGKADKELERLIDRQAKMREMGVKENSRQWQSLQYDIDLARQKLETYKYDLQGLEYSGKAFVSGADTSQYQQLEATLSEASNRLAEMRSDTQQSASLMSRFAAAARRASENVGATARKVGGALVSALKAAGNSFLRIVSGGKSANRQLTSLISNAKKFALSMLGARGVYALLRKAVSAYMSENQELTNKLNACWSGIGNLLGPIIERLINLVATAVAYVTSFLRLFGVFGGKATKSAKQAAGAAKELKNQVASFDELNKMGEKDSGGGGGADDQTAGLPNVELPDWAKLMVDQIKAGDWAAAAMTLTDQLNGMVAGVDWVGIGSKIGYYLNGALTFLATVVQTFDWNGLGARLAEMVNNVITSVDWYNLGVLLAAKVTILFRTLGSFLENIDGAEVGTAFINVVNGWVASIAEAIKSVNWRTVGANLANGLKAAIEGISWNDIKQLLLAAIRAVFDAVVGFLETIGPEMIMEAVLALIAFLAGKVAIATLFAPIISAIGTALAGIIGSIVAAIAGWPALLIAAAAVAILALIAWMKNGGAEVVAGLLEGIGNAIKSVGAWLKAHLVDPIVNAVKSLFGIHSPSKVFAEIGGYLIQGLLQGIKNAWSAITGFFSKMLSSLANLISNAWTGIKNTASKAWTGIKNVVTGAWSGIKSGVSSAVSKVGSGVSSAWSNIKSWTSDKWKSIKGAVSGTWDSIKSGVSSSTKNVGSSISSTWNSVKSNTASVWNGVKATLSSSWNSLKAGATSAWNDMKNTVTNGWNNVKSNTTNTWNAVKSTLTSTWGNLKSGATSTWNTLKTTVTTGWNNIKSNTSSTWSSIKSSLTSTWSNLKSTASTSWASLKSTISTGWNNIKADTSSTWSSISSLLSSTWSSIQSTASSKWSSIKSSITNQGWYNVGSNICDGIARGIDNGWSWLSNKVSSLARSLLNKAKSALGIHSPSRVFRDQVGLNIGYGIGEGIEGSEVEVLKSVTSLADAIAEEANAGDFSIKGIVPTTEIDGALVNFTDKITDSFTAMLDRLQAIAERVTFAVPAVANGAVPYKVSSSSRASTAADTQLSTILELSDTVDERMADLSYKLSQLIAVVKALDLNIDIEALTKMITRQQRTNIRNFGGV